MLADAMLCRSTAQQLSRIVNIRSLGKLLPSATADERPVNRRRLWHEPRRGGPTMRALKLSFRPRLYNVRQSCYNLRVGARRPPVLLRGTVVAHAKVRHSFPHPITPHLPKR